MTRTGMTGIIENRNSKSAIAERWMYIPPQLKHIVKPGAPMVNRIIEAMVPHPSKQMKYAYQGGDGGWIFWDTAVSPEFCQRLYPPGNGKEFHWWKGRVGDRLWLKEQWRPRSWGSDFDWMMIEFKGGPVKEIDPQSVWSNPDKVWEALSIECINAGCPQTGNGDFILQDSKGKHPIRWRSPVTMNRSLSRFVLEVSNVQPVKTGDRWDWFIDLATVEGV